MDKVCDRPDSCNGEFTWPRQWGDEHLAPAIEMRQPVIVNSAGLVVVERGYVMADGTRRNAVVKHGRDPCSDGDRPLIRVTIGGELMGLWGAIERSEAVILRDLLNEVLEATSS